MTTRLNVMPFGTQVIFPCPITGRDCAANLKGMKGDEEHVWVNVGTDEKPTLIPSIDCATRCGWHGYIVDGEPQTAPPGLSTIVACSSCKAPHLIHVPLSHDASGALQIGLKFIPFASARVSGQEKP